MRERKVAVYPVIGAVPGNSKHSINKMMGTDLQIFFFNKFIYFILFIFGCVGSSLLHTGFL